MHRLFDLHSEQKKKISVFIKESFFFIYFIISLVISSVCLLLCQIFKKCRLNNAEKKRKLMTKLAHKNDDEYSKTITNIFFLFCFNRIYRDHPYHHHLIRVQLVSSVLLLLLVYHRQLMQLVQH